MAWVVIFTVLIVGLGAGRLAIESTRPDAVSLTEAEGWARCLDETIIDTGTRISVRLLPQDATNRGTQLLYETKKPVESEASAPAPSPPDPSESPPQGQNLIPATGEFVLEGGAVEILLASGARFLLDNQTQPVRLGQVAGERYDIQGGVQLLGPTNPIPVNTLHPI